MKSKSFDILEKFYKSLILGENFLNLPENRLSIYQTLVFNNIEDTCSKAFPITKEILKEDWDGLIKDFLKNHKFSSPYLWEVPKDFISYLENKGFFKNKRFLHELMVYEWVEMEVFNEDLPINKRQLSWYEKYKISNTAKILNFKYPVHKISQIGIEKIDEYEDSYFLIIYQNPENYEVEYLEITPFLYEVLSSLDDTLFKSASKVCSKYGVSFEEISPQLEEFFKLLIKNKIIV